MNSGGAGAFTLELEGIGDPQHQRSKGGGPNDDENGIAEDQPAKHGKDIVHCPGLLLFEEVVESWQQEVPLPQCPHIHLALARGSGKLLGGG